MKKFVSKYKNRMLLYMYLTMGLLTQMSPLMANATSGEQVITDSLGSLYSIIAAFVTSVGAIITLWGVFEWGTSMQSNDGTMQANAFKRIGGGLVIILAPNIIQGFI